MTSSIHPSCVVLIASLTTALGQPVITVPPTDRSVSLGANVSFQVSAQGPTPLIYQWRYHGLDIASATNRLLTITNIQLTHAGEYSVVVSNDSGTVSSQVARLEVDPTFTKITTGPVVEARGLSVGSAWVDYDDDGFLDLFITGAASTSNSLFRNERNGQFTRIAKGAIVNTLGDYRGASWIDYDNDGELDLYVVSTGGYGCNCPWNYLYRNDGNATFTAPPASVVGSLVGANGVSQNAAWADYDLDGFLDLVVITHGRDLFFRNNGNGSFARITDSPLTRDTIDNYAAAWSDYDNDGDPDLFVAAFGTGTDRLHRNNGDGTFSRVTAGPIVARTSVSYGPTWIDFNNDGWQDLFVPNADGTPNFLYRNDGNGTFTQIITGELVGRTGNNYSCAWGDYDNDGFLDVLLCNRGGADKLLFHNEGDGTFRRITSGSLVHDGGNSVSATWGDYDNDGFLDLVVANGGGDSREENFLYRNNGNPKHWLKVKLVGTVSNRSAIGAKVRVRATIGGRSIWQLREMSMSAKPGMDTPIAHFGLGDAANVETLRIEWPSGAATEMSELAAKQFLTVIEPPRLTVVTRTDGAAKVALRGGLGFSYTLESSPDLKTWLPLRTNTAAGLTLEFEDSEAGRHARRFYRARFVK